MKIRILAVTVVVAIAGLLGWYMHPAPAETPAKQAAVANTPTKPSTPKPVLVAAPVLPPSSQIAQPVAVAKPNPAASATETPLTDPQPQSDLDACLTQSIKLLEARDLVGLVKTLMPPSDMQQMMQATGAASAEDLAAALRGRMPNLDKEMEDIIQAMHQVQGQVPELNTAGTRAVYNVDPPAGSNSKLTFVKVDGNWYME